METETNRDLRLQKIRSDHELATLTKKLENYNVAEVGPIIKLMCVCVCICVTKKLENYNVAEVGPIIKLMCVCVYMCDKETGEL